MGRWQIVDVSTREGRCAIPNVPGVYVFVRDGRVIYVGQSTALRNRLGTYSPWRRRVLVPYSDVPEHQGGVFESELIHGAVVKISPTKRYGDWLMRELRLIRRLQPHGNLHRYQYGIVLLRR